MTDTMRDRFEKWVVSTDNHQFFMVGRPRFERHEYGSYVSATCQNAWEAYQAAQADARALVGELVRNWFALNNHGGVEVSAAGDDAAKVWNSMCQTIDKAQAFMEGK